jgi:FtsP/CotA-like multicopper oxidase with cupredoxin domain
VHWHGIELDNANDGTTVTQNLVPTGGSFTYRFRLPRPGIYWYHPHAMATNQLFKGMYGSLIVEDPDAPKLIGLGVLPDAVRTWTLVLSDITVCKAPGRNDPVTYAPGADVPWAFTGLYGPFPGLTAYPSPRDLCESPRDNHGMPGASGPLAEGDIPNIQVAATCLPPRTSCRVNEGQLVLANGRVAAPRAGTPERPGGLGPDAEALTARSGEGLRLQLVNAAGARYFRLRLTDARGKDVPILRIGGQGGLLDRVRIEGGKIGSRDARYARGELVLAPAERADVVVTARGRPGDVMTLWTEDFQHYGTAEYPYGYGALPTLPVAHIRIEDGAPARPYRLAAGDPLRMHPAVGHPTESIREAGPVAALVDPARLSPARPGSKDSLVLLAVVGRETIDGVSGMALEGSADGKGDYRDIPHIDSSRYARVGDLIEMTIRNGTQMHHPWHLHGFSFQPVRLEDNLGNPVYEFDYAEFVDTLDIPSTHRLVFRVRLDDRGAVGGPDGGGALGRWMMHCHIFNHNGVGMMTELVVLPGNEPEGTPLAGTFRR